VVFFGLECEKSPGCAPVKHHYDECVERVTSQMEENDGKANENCVEECTFVSGHHLVPNSLY
jgi:hypothetical protein